MPEILRNERISKDLYLMKVKAENATIMGQFYILRTWGDYPPLSRPISMFNTDRQTVSFLYKVVGKGAEISTTFKPGDEITPDGPHRNSFPEARGTIAPVDSGVGIVPLYLTAKKLKELSPGTIVNIYLGLSDEAPLVDLYKKIVDGVIVNIGRFVTDGVDPLKYNCIVTCEPGVMMRILYEKRKSLRV